MTPNIAIVHVQIPEQRRNFRLWVPLFLLWIPALLLSPLILLALVVLLVACVLWQVSFFGALRTFWGLLCSLPGTDVRVTAEGKKILVRIL